MRSMAKFSHEFLKRFFQEDLKDSRVEMGPRYGEDAAVIKFGKEYLVVHPDPISGALENIGWLSIHIPANDIAAAGAKPCWALPTVQTPEDFSKSKVERLLDEMCEAARGLNVGLIGGHTETVEFIDRPMVTTCMMGLTGSPIYTHTSNPGDLLVQIGDAGIEGTWVLVTDAYDKLESLGVSEACLHEVLGWRNDISVVDDALRLRDTATSMHDATEGGLLQGAYEMAFASGNRFEIHRAPSVREATLEICGVLNVDPLRLIASGCLLATVPPDTELPVGKVIGKVTEGEPGLFFDSKKVGENTEDELFRVLREMN